MESRARLQEARARAICLPHRGILLPDVAVEAVAYPSCAEVQQGFGTFETSCKLCPCITRIPQRTKDDCTICVVAMVMGPPYTYERVLEDSSKYPKSTPNGNSGIVGNLFA